MHLGRMVGTAIVSKATVQQQFAKELYPSCTNPRAASWQT